ncbi:DNA recombination protein RmuC [Thiomicrorhabdus sediminis]|uniref:DNA recombination protein RmuC n=1 Tax=Thiomicrorhabdus sediminis TaxID=2580412 RepID=A0A4P9K8E9_9GAMM|nr:DNA recombination protein RmuC [Thiomicrorhabdus sediminis]QCU90686.1 DNA recombination protein RmuC [Thiomicrorhabdus sediminis]
MDLLTLLASALGLAAATSFWFFNELRKQKNQLSQLQQENTQIALLQHQLETLLKEQQIWQQQQQSFELAQQKVAALGAENQALQQQVQDFKATQLSKEGQLQELRDKLAQSDNRLAELTTQLDNEKANAAEKIALLENAKQQMSSEFQNLANQIFEQKQQQFQQSSQVSMEAVLKPMQQSLNAFKERVELVHKEDLEGRAGLTEQLKQLQALNAQMTTEAHNLTQALKGDSKTQGNWGELVLERLLERSGLTEGIEFDREKSFTNNDGSRLRPDVIINLPDNKHIIIDSKVSLTDYEQALNSDSENPRQRAVKAHLSSLKKHISTLADKRYEHLDKLNAPDFILMFVPVEGAYLMAIEADSSVFESAFEQRVAVVTPTTLFTTLKTIEQLWRYERQSENTVKLIKRAAEVHDKFVGFVESFEKVGNQLNTAQTTYEKARKQMLSGSGNLVRQAEMLKELAGRTKKEIPDHLLEEAKVNVIEDGEGNL